MPAQAQVSLLLSLSAGIFPIRTVGAPATHGAAVTGTHGIGVSTPNAAAVAAMTVGFDGLEHMPNGGMFTIGAKSMIVAAGAPVSVRFVGRTAKVAGAAPKLHCIIAPAQTWHAMIKFLSLPSL
jgi:hypothetical protein